MTSPVSPTVAERRTPAADSLELMSTDAERLRDRLTVDHLVAFARSLDAGARPISYQRDWWDGSAAVGCLLVDIHGRRHRVVDTGAGTPVLLPAWRVRARRALTASRRASSEPLPAGSSHPSDHVVLTSPPAPSQDGPGPRQQGPAPPSQAPPHGIASGTRGSASTERRTVVQSGDYVVCRYADCGGLQPLGDETMAGGAGCPSCGRR